MRRLTALTAAAVSLPVLAGVSADEAAKLGNELTPIGAISAGNEAGTEHLLDLCSRYLNATVARIRQGRQNGHDPG